MSDDFGDLVPFWERQGNEDTKWRLITNTIEKALTLGVTLTETAFQLRLHDFTFGNDRFNQLFRERREYRVQFNYPATLDLYETPDPNRIAVKSTGGRGNYQYVVEYDNYDPLSQTYYTERKSIFDENLYSQGDLLELMDSEDFSDTSANPNEIEGTRRLVGMFRQR